MTQPPAPPPDPPSESTSESEVRRLRQQVENLQGELAHGAPPPQPPRGALPARIARSTGVVVLLIIVGLLAPLAVVARWADAQIGNTDQFVKTVAPLASDPAVQSSVADRIVDEIFTYVPIDTLLKDALDAQAASSLPPRVSAALRTLSGPLANAARSFVQDRVDQFVRSENFAEAWTQAVEEAHEQMVAVLEGTGTSTVAVDNGAVSVNLATILSTVKANLVDSGFEAAARIPQVDVEFTLFKSADLTKAQSLFKALNNAATWLPVIALAAAAGAIGLSRRRRRTGIIAALVITASMLLLGATLNILRPLYLDAVPSNVISSDTAAAIYDALVGWMRQSLRAVAALGITAALVTWLLAPSGSGRQARETLRGGIRSARVGLRRFGGSGPVSTYIRAHRRTLLVGILAVLSAAYVLQDHPTGRSTMLLIITGAVAAIVVEFVAAPVPAAPATGGETKAR